ncbi:ABC transporter ATP-binding protein [Roseateles saccharophilus]|uniref:Cu-processing system ATP-binding protein n=1 Tax=Roseateles saccharophilus TaxID=304 RepID=A0A4V2VS65_ROSSA|nr:ABC transporter ATP-binding protein [Roseateles saccharophilus]MDG0831749.1 ABC transporter ATP-binding protein [Roseateles saccharophilus]TCV01230.1 Cu-processing system ATP-binding protein [Roseateles saccharophilus]
MAGTSNDSGATAAVALNGVSKRFGRLCAVDGIDLTVQRGELFALIGHNGAGKSTLFKMMLGLLTPSAGSIRITGQAVTGRAFREVRRHIGYLPESLVLYDNLSGLETLQFFARLKQADLRSCAGLLERMGLAAAANRPVREYSKGMRQRLGFAQALLGEPHVLFLDEPTNGLDPAARRDFFAQLGELRARGVTLIITSHVLSELQSRVDRLAIMAEGRLQAVGSVQDLREQLALPVMIELRAGADIEPALRTLLAPLAGVTVVGGANGCTIRCPRPLKMEVLALLAPLASRLDDLSLNEPSLEDMFFSTRRESSPAALAVAAGPAPLAFSSVEA